MRAFATKHLWLLLSLLVALWAGRYLLTSRHFYTHDDMQVFRVNEYVQCLRDGQIPCRWSANLGKGYGYPLFNFYPPVIYLIPSLLHLAGIPLTTSLNLLMFASFILAGWGIYLLARSLTKSPVLSFLASALYTLYPFHAVNVFVRGVYAENLVWSLLPLILYLMTAQARHHRYSRTLPLLLAGVYLTHLIGSVLVTGFVALWALWHRDLKRVSLQILLALGLSAFFLIPALGEKSLVQTESMITGYFAFTNHYVSTYQLFGQYKWSYDASLWSAAPDEMPYMVGHVHTVLLVISLTLLIISLVRHQIALSHSRQIKLAGWLLLAATSLLFLSHFKSDFVWQLIPPLAYVQFPWRFIAWAALPLVLTIVLLLSHLPRQPIHFFTVITVTLLLVYSSPFFRPREYDQLVDADILNGQQRSEQQVKSLYDYLPHTVRVLPEPYATHSPTSIRTSRTYSDSVVVNEEGVLTLPVFYYPGWTAQIDGVTTVIPDSPDSGLITLPLGPGTHQIELRFAENPLRQIADSLSLFSLALTGAYVILNSYGQKKSAL